MSAAKTGHNIQVETILARELTSVNEPVKKFHPMMAPTMAWEVDTGNRARVMR